MRCFHQLWMKLNLKSCSQWRLHVQLTGHAHEVVFYTAGQTFLDAVTLSPAAWKPLNSSRATSAVLCGVTKFSKGGGAFPWSFSVELRQHGGRRQATSSAETTCPIIPWTCQSESGQSFWHKTCSVCCFVHWRLLREGTLLFFLQLQPPADHKILSENCVAITGTTLRR